MSTVNLKTKSEILDFFKILAEESVKDARSKILDPAAEVYLEKSKKDKKVYSSITEEDEEEFDIDFEEEVGSQEGSPADSAAQDSPDSPTDSSGKNASSNIEQVSLDSVREKIKSMRSGLSVDDTSVQDPMRTYFDLLSDPERKALYAFLDALASIMTGAATGETASDPSDPPYNVQMTSQKPKNSTEPESSRDESPQAEPASDDTDTEEEAPEEDQVPIQVGSVQESKSVERIRNKVKELLKRS